MAKEVFLIEDDGRTALFAPLKGLIMEVDEREREKLSPIINRPQFSFGELREIFPEIEDARLLPEPGEEQGVAENTTDEFQPDSVMLFPTLGCHLRCIYCYSMGGDNALSMDREIVEAAVDFVIRNAESRGLEECSLDFHGGGEPTWDWSVFQSALNYFREKVREYGLKPRVSLATNGMLSSQQVDWITERVQKIQVSLDGMAEIQNSQRPTANNTESFPTVSRTVALLRARGVPVAIHSVITERSMARIPEIIRFFGENFPGATVQLEPAFPCGRGLTSGQLFPSTDLFVKGFVDALEVVAAFGIEVLYSGAGQRLTEFRNNFCGATDPNFIVTPTALVTACTEVATMEHPLAGYFIYGRFDRPSGRKMPEHLVPGPLRLRQQDEVEVGRRRYRRRQGPP